jgi:hypothetical protein
MPPSTRKTRSRRASLSVQRAAVSMHRGAAATHGPPDSTYDPKFYDSNEDYDSDVCLEQPLKQRVSSKLRSAIHVAGVDLDDDEGFFPRDMEHDLETVEPKLEDLAELLVEAQESINWWRDVDARLAPMSDVDVLCHMYRFVKRGDEVIGDALLLELKMQLDTYYTLYRGLVKHRSALASSLLVRRVRKSHTDSGRATRCVPTEQTTGEALVVWLEGLKQKVDAAVVKCGERV